MGGNGASEKGGGVPLKKRTHTDTKYRIDGHKVLLQTKDFEQDKSPLNSNSESPYYLTGKLDDDGNIVVSCINTYQKHMIDVSIDLEFDSKGNFIPYSESNKKSSHSHKWTEMAPGIMGRKSHDKNNNLPIDSKYQSLIDKIVEFNKSKKKWTK